MLRGVHVSLSIYRVWKEVEFSGWGCKAGRRKAKRDEITGEKREQMKEGIKRRGKEGVEGPSMRV